MSLCVPGGESNGILTTRDTKGTNDTKLFKNAGDGLRRKLGSAGEYPFRQTVRAI